MLLRYCQLEEFGLKTIDADLVSVDKPTSHTAWVQYEEMKTIAELTRTASNLVVFVNTTTLNTVMGYQWRSQKFLIGEADFAKVLLW